MDAFRDALRRGLRGQGAHVEPEAALEGLSAGQAGTKLPGHPHTIWEILGHVLFWQTQWITAVQGGTPILPEHAEGGWPKKGGPRDDVELREALADFGSGLQEAERLTREGDLQRSVPEILGGTAALALFSLAYHNSYHLGQIVLLRRAMDAWPPPKGGITW